EFSLLPGALYRFVQSVAPALEYLTVSNCPSEELPARSILPLLSTAIYPPPAPSTELVQSGTPPWACAEDGQSSSRLAIVNVAIHNRIARVRCPRFSVFERGGYPEGWTPNRRLPQSFAARFKGVFIFK